MQEYTIASFRAAEGVTISAAADEGRRRAEGQLVVLEEPMPRPEFMGSWAVVHPISGAHAFPARYNELSPVRSVQAPSNPATSRRTSVLFNEGVRVLGLPGGPDWRGRIVCKLQDGLHLVEKLCDNTLYVALDGELDFGQGFGRIPANPRRRGTGDDMEELVA